MVMTTRTTRRIAAHAHARHKKLIRKANAASLRAERAVRRQWNELLRAIMAGDSRRASFILHSLHLDAIASVAASLTHVAQWSYRGAVKAIADVLPVRLHEKREDEDRTPAEWAALLFPKLSPMQVNRVVYARDWQERLRRATRLADPGRLAYLTSTGLLLGKTHQEIARDLKPAVQGVVASARRVARTECMRVADRVQFAAHDQLGDLVAGYQIHSAHSPFSRHWHVKRDKTIYWIDPKPGQKGLRQMPQPPDEADDPAERPAGAPHTAFN